MSHSALVVFGCKILTLAFSFGKYSWVQKALLNSRSSLQPCDTSSEQFSGKLTV
ncbi:hypothetical protein CAAN1_19S02762 [[Candida] anglica]|uniref:Uncharacterized protein n=1 Tax=[Candida] anglica TaxID=148631 RepID=A0ABP0E5F6_9ASCO